MKKRTKLNEDNFLLWLPSSILGECEKEASVMFPFETGGAFMGWWADSKTIVVKTYIGAGPDSRHEKFCFEQDHSWEQKQIANNYFSSNKEEEYLGGWHSHPTGLSGVPSGTDRLSLKKIIDFEAARCLSPIMLIFYGEPDTWEYNIWMAQLIKRKYLWDKLVLRQIKVKLY